MKDNSKIIILSVIVITLALGTYYYLRNGMNNLSPTVTPSVQPIVESPATDDAQLNNDINTVDNNLKSLDSQSSQADTSLNQTAVDPSQ